MLLGLVDLMNFILILPCAVGIEGRERDLCIGDFLLKIN